MIALVWGSSPSVNGYEFIQAAPFTICASASAGTSRADITTTDPKAVRMSARWTF